MVGGGHNGLVAAAYLARNGLDTVVCERRDVTGGAAKPVTMSGTVPCPLLRSRIKARWRSEAALRPSGLRQPDVQRG